MTRKLFWRSRFHSVVLLRTPWPSAPGLSVPSRLHDKGPHDPVWLCIYSAITRVDEHKLGGTSQLSLGCRSVGVLGVIMSVLREHLVLVSPCNSSAVDLRMQGLHIGRWSGRSEYRSG